MTRKLTGSDLDKGCTVESIELLKIEDDKELMNEIIGQNSAAEALQFGLNIKAKGFNIYVAGQPGSGKTTFAEKFARDIAEGESVPDDMCYVYNFEEPKNPILLKLKAGDGKAFKEDMEELVHVLSLEIPKAFSTNEYEAEKERILKNFQDKKDEIFKTLSEEAKELGFGVKSSNGGIYFMPIIDGKTITEEEFDELDDEEKDKITDTSEDIQKKASEVMKVIKEVERETKKELDEIEYNIGLLTLGHYITNIQDKYIDNERISRYLSFVKEDILNNIGDFIEEDSDEEDPIAAVVPWISKRTVDEAMSKYRVNLIVDNSQLKGAPVIVHYNPTYINLIGEVEYDNENGNFTTDYMKIKPGILHKANGGYLILQVSDLLGNSFAWETLRRVLKTGEIIIEPLREYQLGGISVTSIKPESAEINLKVVLVGTNYYYELLNEYDDDFGRLFKICAMFDYEMEKNKENFMLMVKFINGYIARETSLEIDTSGMCELIDYATRLAERQDKFTTRFSQINDIMTEANTWARLAGENIISGESIKKAIDKKINRINLYEQKYNEMILDNEIMIETVGSKVGQINGLCVMEMGNYTFGKPTKITASTYMGKAGIINIEKEAELSGAIHDKGVQVLIGYIGSTYAQEFPLSLSSRICFEQNYNGVDGDSASSTELYAVISSLSGIPINQELAVTGSINQRGEIQPIGGVTYKVEGFYDICAARGLTGNQGVIIPEQNVKDLVLKKEVLEAVENERFHIYAISNVDEGIELLMGKEAGKKNTRGHYAKGTVHYKVMEKLKKYHQSIIEE